ncbi:MAG: Hsp20/alpha crystallin family protein [Firmicutes bacterium]|nr:Hsp20/alpha crystallin family protein [Bacillota bacterium]HOB35417.1 Hsp20/alpha crystallin family protein [Bacillota bacterium]HPZ91214.1 Hsp20/alpha crystallin family protein [Bacillota bacterium]HQE02368.1 Hsp20/alpha crystallin family protein [Bacillota bacterium]
MFKPAPFFGNRWFPRSFLRDFFSDDFFFPGLSSIKADIYEKDGKLIIEAELPGFDKDEVKVHVSDNQLTISAERRQAKEEKSENYIRRERSFNHACRTFIIEDLDPDKIEAKFENGVLRLTMPKPEKLLPQAREIKIR